MSEPTAPSPLPRTWSPYAKTALVNAVALARVAMTAALASLSAKRRDEELLQLRSEVALLREELRLKDARFSKLAPERTHEDHRYEPAPTLHPALGHHTPGRATPVPFGCPHPVGRSGFLYIERNGAGSTLTSAARRPAVRCYSRRRMPEGGDDPAHDFSGEEKDALEANLRAEALELLKKGDPKGRRRKLAQAVEISRRKSKKSHQHGI